jgi:hypothetical protein
MLNRIARNTLPIRILFLAVYAILFSVQLHLKYDFLAIRHFHAKKEKVVVLNAETTSAKHRNIEQHFIKKEPNIKVSKRFLHKSIYEIPATESLITKAFPQIRPTAIFSVSRLCQLSMVRSLLRGPPTAC